MASFNKIILIGNLTRDPEMRVTPGGMAITKFGLAVNRKFTDKSGEKREEVLFIDVDAFGKQAEIVSQYFHKGKPILVEGRLKLDQWETNSGEKRSKIGVVMESFGFVGGRDDDQQQPPERSESKPAGRQPDLPDLGEEEDVPF